MVAPNIKVIISGRKFADREVYDEAAVTKRYGVTPKQLIELKGLVGDNDYSAFGITNKSHGDCATGEALGIFQITQAELDGNWPPPVVYTP